MSLIYIGLNKFLSLQCHIVSFAVLFMNILLFFEVQTCCRAASVLSHILKDNIQCKERVCNLISPLFPNVFPSTLIRLLNLENNCFKE